MSKNMTMSRKTAIMMAGIMSVGGLTLSAANPVIGVVLSGAGQAGVSIDGSRVSSDATLFEGSVVSSVRSSRVQLNAGTRIDLSEDSLVRVFANYVSLVGGGSRVQSSSGYMIDARSLRIQPSDAGSVATVRLDGDQKVLVAALNAPVNVWNHDGILVARVMPQMPMSFLPQAASSGAFDNSGCVINKQGYAVLVDATGNQTFELTTTVKTIDLRKYVGKRSKVEGTLSGAKPDVTGVSQVVSVATISSSTGPSCEALATSAGGTTTAAGMTAAAVGAGAVGAAVGAGAAAGAAAGISTTAIVVGGVAAAAVAVTAAGFATNGFGTQSSNLPACGAGGPGPGVPATCH